MATCCCADASGDTANHSSPAAPIKATAANRVNNPALGRAISGRAPQRLTGEMNRDLSALLAHRLGGELGAAIGEAWRRDAADPDSGAWSVASSEASGNSGAPPSLDSLGAPT